MGVGENLRRLILRVIGMTTKEEVTEGAGSAQVCAGHSSACEAAAHSVQDRFERPETEVLLLVDASNAFNRMNRAQALRNVRELAPTLGTAARNVYGAPSRVFLSDGTCIDSVEGTVQGCPLAMQTFALSTVPMIRRLDEATRQQLWYADDSAALGRVAEVARWFKLLREIGPVHGYDINLGKTVAVVKAGSLADFQKMFGDLAKEFQVHVAAEDCEMEDARG